MLDGKKAQQRIRSEYKKKQRKGRSLTHSFQYMPCNLTGIEGDWRVRRKRACRFYVWKRGREKGWGHLQVSATITDAQSLGGGGKERHKTSLEAIQSGRLNWRK